MHYEKRRQSTSNTSDRTSTGAVAAILAVAVFTFIAFIVVVESNTRAKGHYPVNQIIVPPEVAPMVPASKAHA